MPGVTLVCHPPARGPPGQVEGVTVLCTPYKAVVVSRVEMEPSKKEVKVGECE